jgi:hypothetical protein
LTNTRRRCVRYAVLLAFAATPAMAQDVVPQEPGTGEPPQVYPTTEFKNDATMLPPADPSVGTLPVLTVAEDDIKVAEATGTETDFDTTAARASIAEIDPTNDQPEVYFASYSGGAHCCTTIIVVDKVGDDWKIVPVGDFDGDGDYLEDLDGDGFSEIVTVDNRFLYVFDSYAATAMAPLVIYSAREGAVEDLTAETHFLPNHREWLGQMEEAVAPEERWTSRGFLAGWLGEKIRLGEGAAAWNELNAHWDFTADEGMEICTTGVEVEECPEEQRKNVKFPEALQLFLNQNGYVF